MEANPKQGDIDCHSKVSVAGSHIDVTQYCSFHLCQVTVIMFHSSTQTLQTENRKRKCVLVLAACGYGATFVLLKK